MKWSLGGFWRGFSNSFWLHFHTCVVKNFKYIFSFFFCKRGILVGGPVLKLYMVDVRIFMSIATIYWEFTECLTLDSPRLNHELFSRTALYIVRVKSVFLCSASKVTISESRSLIISRSSINIFKNFYSPISPARMQNIRSTGSSSLALCLK